MRSCPSYHSAFMLVRPHTLLQGDFPAALLQMTDTRPSVTVAVGAVRAGGVAPDRLVEIGTRSHGSTQVSVRQIGAGRVGITEVGSGEVGSIEVGSIEVGVAEVGAAEVGPGKVRVEQVGSREVGTRQVGIGESEPGQVAPGQGRTRSAGHNLGVHT